MRWADRNIPSMPTMLRRGVPCATVVTVHEAQGREESGRGCYRRSIAEASNSCSAVDRSAGVSTSIQSIPSTSAAPSDPAATSWRMPEDTVSGSSRGTRLQRVEDRGRQHEAAGVDRVPRLDAFADRGHWRPSRRTFVASARSMSPPGARSISTRPASPRPNGSAIESGQRHAGKDMIDHLQIEVVGEPPTRPPAGTRRWAPRRRGFRRNGDPGPETSVPPRRLNPIPLVSDDDHGPRAPAGARVFKRVGDERQTANRA